MGEAFTFFGGDTLRVVDSSRFGAVQGVLVLGVRGMKPILRLGAGGAAGVGDDDTRGAGEDGGGGGGGGGGEGDSGAGAGGRITTSTLPSEVVSTAPRSAVKA